MGWFEAIMLIASLATTAYTATVSGNDQPVLPGYVPPDLGPIREQGKFADFQRDTRETLLDEYYGNGLTPYLKYSNSQTQINDEMMNQLPADLTKYYADRGIDQTTAITAGAREELGKKWNQRRLDINAKSHDIYALTLGTLLGEVSDAGMQTTQMTGALGSANAMENQRRDQSYASAMQKWQYDKSQPTTAGTIGGMLPYLGMLYGGMSGGAGGGYDPNYAAGSGGSSFNPGMSQYNNSWNKYRN